MRVERLSLTERQTLRTLPRTVFWVQLIAFLVLAIVVLIATGGPSESGTSFYWLLIFGWVSGLFFAGSWWAWSSYVVRPALLSGVALMIAAPVAIFFELLTCGALADFLRSEGIILVGAVGLLVDAGVLVFLIYLLIRGAQLAREEA